MNFSNYILFVADSGSLVVLLLLDPSAAFDTVDHDILIDRLKDQVGVQGLAFDWFSSYLKVRTISLFSFCYATNMWGSSGLHFGICFVPPLFASMISEDVKTYLFSVAFNNGLKIVCIVSVFLATFICLLLFLSCTA